MTKNKFRREVMEKKYWNSLKTVDSNCKGKVDIIFRSNKFSSKIFKGSKKDKSNYVHSLVVNQTTHRTCNKYTVNSKLLVQISFEFIFCTRKHCYQDRSRID